MKTNILQKFFDTNKLDILDESLVKSILANDSAQVNAALAAGANIYLELAVDYVLFDYVYDECSLEVYHLFKKMSLDDDSQELLLVGDI